MAGDSPILAELKRDLQAFADPHTPVIIDRQSAVWEQDGVEMIVEFEQSKEGGLPVIIHKDKRYAYRQFLASPAMADLSRLGQFITRTAEREASFIETSGQWHDEDAGAERTDAATELIQWRTTTDLPFMSTRVVLVRGEAGSGKTMVLREMAYRQAERYEQGDAEGLYFYVDAQGRALSRLEDAMAKDLQDLRSRFSYSAVAPLTRHRLLVPIIDGFDELLGSGGYEEAFSSLAALLSLLDGRGCVIASARSAFFDYRNFYENAARFSGEGRLNYEVDVVEVLPWSMAQIRGYFARYAASEGAEGDDIVGHLDDLADRLDERNRSLLSKPFYAARLADLLLNEAEIDTNEALLDQLVDAFLQREHKKLLDKEGQPLLSREGHQRFLTLLAEEMWWQESQRIDVATIQAVAELVVEAFSLPASNARAIVERVSSYAFLSTDRAEGASLRFEHEVLYGYFLAGKLQDCIEREPADLRRFISRSVLDTTLAEQATRLIGTTPERCREAIESVCGVLRPGLSEIVARENAGRIIVSVIGAAEALPEDLELRNVFFRQISFGDCQLNKPRFVRCDMEDVDITESRWVEANFQGCSIRGLLIEVRSTSLEGTSPSLSDQVYSIKVRDGDERISPGHYFDPDMIVRVLEVLGVESLEPGQGEVYSEAIKARIDMLDRFLRKMERRFYASYRDVERFPFAEGEAWRQVFEGLLEYGLLEEEIRAKSGPREPLLKLTVPPEIIRRGENRSDESVPSSVKVFWLNVLKS